MRPKLGGPIWRVTKLQMFEVASPDSVMDSGKKNHEKIKILAKNQNFGEKL